MTSENENINSPAFKAKLKTLIENKEFDRSILFNGSTDKETILTKYEQTELSKQFNLMIDNNIYNFENEITEFILNCDVLEESKPFSWDDVENLNYIDEDKEEQQKEIYQWFKVSDWFCDKLREQEEVVIHDFKLWGRGCCGQSVELDTEIQDIFLNWWVSF